MKISAFNQTKQSFASNTPIYHVYVRHKDGSVSELESREIKGPALGLVKRLNDTYSREAQFLKEHIYDFNEYPLATSSIIGRNDFKKKHIIFGEDAATANAIREDCYRKGNMTTEEVKAAMESTTAAMEANETLKAAVDKAVADGTLTAVLGTNLTYRTPELLSRDWYLDVDCSKYTAYFIAAINHDMSVSSICDPIVKIKNLLDERK